MSSIFNRAANRAIKDFAVAALRRRLSYDRGDTALVLVGVQQDFLDDGAPVPALARLIATCRTAGVRVIYAPAVPPTPSNGVRFPTPSQQALLAAGALGPGTAGAATHPSLGSEVGDICLNPHAGLSAFHKTGLADHLSKHGIHRVIVAGTRTDVEIDSTARDAVELGFQTTVVSDCCAGTSPGNHHASIAITLPRVVHGVLKLDDLAARLTSTG